MAEFKMILPVQGTITGGFREQYTTASGQTYLHRGVDIAPFAGFRTPTVASAAGKAILHPLGDGWGDGSYGNCVIIDAPGTPWYIIHAHLDEISPDISDGMIVLRGTTIGFAGTTGLSTGVHVHWEMNKTRDFFPDIANCDDPLLYLDTDSAPDLLLEERVKRLENLIGAYGLLGQDNKTLIFGEAALKYAESRQFSAILSGQLAQLRHADLANKIADLADEGMSSPAFRDRLIDELREIADELEGRG